MVDVTRIIESIETAINVLSDVGKNFGGFSKSHGMGFYLNEAKSMLPDLIKLLPFEVGDRIELVRNHPCPNAWDSCKHFLIKGAEGTIESIGYYDDRGFYADIVFDDETWIDRKGIAQPVSSKHTFNMPFGYLRKINESKGQS